MPADADERPDSRPFGAFHRSLRYIASLLSVDGILSARQSGGHSGERPDSTGLDVPLQFDARHRQGLTGSLTLPLEVSH